MDMVVRAVSWKRRQRTVVWVLCYREFLSIFNGEEPCSGDNDLPQVTLGMWFLSLSSLLLSALLQLTALIKQICSLPSMESESRECQVQSRMRSLCLSTTLDFIHQSLPDLAEGDGSRSPATSCSRGNEQSHAGRGGGTATLCRE